MKLPAEEMLHAGIQAVRLHDTAEAITRRVLLAALLQLVSVMDQTDCDLTLSSFDIEELAAEIGNQKTEG